jgi:NAD(P)-dependent dehydrogenase (short-subunit alcohol dehydrogenase family)
MILTQEDEMIGNLEVFCSPTALKGKVAIVTGAGRGLGRSMALALSRAGSNVVVVARTQSEIDRTADEIISSGGRSLAIQADITNSLDVTKMVERVKTEYGRIDVLVNNAGLNASHVRFRFEDIPEDEWKAMIQTNVTGVFLASQIVGRVMLSQGSGKIINIGSAGGIKPAPEASCYCVSKASVIQMTKALAIEWASRGITVNCIAPGSFDMYPDCTEEKYLTMKVEREKRVPLGRLGKAEELGPLLLFFASSASDYITGQTLFIDGGLVVG